MSLYVKQYLSAGKPDLVMLHGWGMSSDVWGEFAEALSSHFSLTLIDLPGLGRSKQFPTPYTIDAVIELLEGLVPEKAVWLGWSMGGQIAIEFAARHPFKVERLITIASNPCFVQKAEWPHATAEQVHKAFEESLEENVAKTLQRFILLQTQGADSARETLKMLKNLLKGIDHAASKESLVLLREDAREALSQVEMPVLHLFGDKDNLVPVAVSDACQKLSGGQVRIYPGAGHLPFYSHQSDVLNDVLSFVQESIV